MEQGAFGNILGLLRAQSGVDFTHYKEAILRRRIKRRMTALHLESPEDYENYLRAHPSEIQSLRNDILVLMAGFFRLPAAFKWFKKTHGSEPSANESEHSGSATAPGPDCGSTFTVQFPQAGWNQLATTFNPPSLQPDTTNGHGSHSNGSKMQHHATILLVEDHEPTRLALAQILERRHHKVVIASSAHEAIDIAEKGHFDLVISDIGLPDGNGYDLFNKIRDKSPVIKGIALSGYGMEHDLTRSRKTGFKAHLIKPVKIQALEAALEETLAEAA